MAAAGCRAPAGAEVLKPSYFCAAYKTRPPSVLVPPLPALDRAGFPVDKNPNGTHHTSSWPATTEGNEVLEVDRRARPHPRRSRSASRCWPHVPRQALPRSKSPKPRARVRDREAHQRCGSGLRVAERTISLPRLIRRRRIRTSLTWSLVLELSGIILSEWRCSHSGGQRVLSGNCRRCLPWKKLPT